MVSNRVRIEVSQGEEKRGGRWCAIFEIRCRFPLLGNSSGHLGFPLNSERARQLVARHTINYWPRLVRNRGVPATGEEGRIGSQLRLVHQFPNFRPPSLPPCRNLVSAFEGRGEGEGGSSIAPAPASIRYLALSVLRN